MDANLHTLTSRIVSAYVGNNTVAADALPGLINSVYGALSQAGSVPVEAAPREPAVPVRKSITPDYLVCLEDGKKVKMLKRHLRSAYDMSPADYRAKWGLPADYPMVAPNYAATRSEMAKRIGLGKKTT
ncbi:MucR family transcriptional regulator (plasmid) [Azospirillum sp. HJ39]|uniref:MucR family transcriptional regulator n=1 Tax=Azospirillum sp. HJ39 TaxID=3159496 RepID=UPI003556BDF2